ncbi:CK1 family protein kinase [Trichomonas vaginalis G3]|uniref:non-specific serine/threonine protein kinase n=1 Tax=Trichomonas vaginalis (strain ATCC PRA-98 / G3) TaxID=412133 RepID=A2EGK2_TRIV3|nr:STKc CK1 domain-containing protein [Trichomonas vaginalis G3]EAY08197.1 CK1 family protein kinase [Trichomonas vaginalis G3]KAI5519760.1 STKc CK1 domain-containing protein [Trichomonas vaginalis G3]|eukprot:XP_001320420.1 CK1 family protein kinase [Trichomonas vaginalis G3]
MDMIINGKYKVLKKIGAGSFGKIFSGEETETHEQIAVKFEAVNTENPQLDMESKLYMYLSGCVNMPKIRYFGVEGKEKVMVMDLMNKSLEDLFEKCKNKLSLKTVLMIIDQMISCVEYIHNKNFIHQDIKPENFVMGTGKMENQVFIIDFGLAKQYRDMNSHEHIPYTQGKSLTGTARYASINQLRGIESSRRDDMESLGYVWIYFLKGSLPWMGIQAKTDKEKYEKIANMKESVDLNELCKGLPIEFMNYITEVRALRFTETPNYFAYKYMFRDLFMRLGYTYDYKFDWNKPKQKISTPKLSSAYKTTQKAPHTLPASGHVKRKSSMIVSSNNHQGTKETPRRVKKKE